MRIGGLASGMDIDQIVKDMMKAKRMPLDKMKQQKQILEWKRDDYRSINTMLLGFRDRLAQLKLTSNYRARMAASTDEAKVSATVTSGAAQASYSISEIKQLASAATKISGKLSDGNEKFNTSQKLIEREGISWEKGVVESKTLRTEGNSVSLGLNGDKLVEGTLSVKINGKSYDVVTEESDLASGKVLLADGKLTFTNEVASGSAVKVDYVLEEKTASFTVGEKQNMISLGKGSLLEEGFSVKVTIGEETENLVITKGPTNGIAELSNGWKVDLTSGNIMFDDKAPGEGAKVEVKFKQNYTDFTIGTHTSKGEVNERIFVTGNDTLDTVIRKVNESPAGVTMFYDSFSDSLTVTRKETGKFNESGNDINISGDFNNQVLKFNNEEKSGQNAKFTINGLETERQSNTFSMNGVTFTLKQTLKETDPPITVNVSNDSEGVLNTVKEFVDQYNKLIEDINKKLNEERNRKYLPLTDDEREELSDKQQEKWEELAKSGLLKGDPLLSGVLTNMRMDMSSSVETNGLYRQLAAIGITTTANYLDGGKLEINETKLKEAIEKDPEAVENLFRGTGTNDSERGVIHKLYDSVNQSITKIQDRAGRATSTNQQFALGRELISVDKNIDSFETRLKMQEDRLWRQFAAMEKAIQRANDQSLYLMQQFGGM
ncbi:flagellar filament capping protein FliD [Siminovitchia fortis]|uniref:Flagellar hook-associated protein 2 n=1 Tax=Siminovitchia fortis TaxID=254758 RepID=A0A443IZJ3_9BACI|nr:flagellar filament capping protein FliD [Siminovitchia fortis]RWR13577.1 flagellar hook protein [Siminovitchia fortis]WHY81967.1 flagellar filament capping protein FliD [Siminovitchia fortis]